MGIYDRDYERSYDTGSGWKDSGGGGGLSMGGGFGGWSANNKLLAVLVAVYVAQNVFAPGFTQLFSLPANWLLEPWRLYSLVTYSLLHDPGRIYHLLFNGLALFFFGRTMEARLGGREYLTFFFVSAAFAGLVWSGAEAIAPQGNVVPTLIGASGGIAAVLVLFALSYPNVQVFLMGILPVPAWLMAILFVGMDISGALGRSGSGNVAYTAHLGGALFGFLYFHFKWRLSDWLPGGQAGGFKSLLKRRPKLRVHREDDDETAPPTVDKRVDEILRKIQSQGQQSLTPEEQRVLEQASRRYQQRRR